MGSKNRTPSISRAVADLWRSVSTELFGTYHPEQHYMRGPGPKWRAKHARKTIVSEPGLGGVAKIAA
jgi:hypothetical protein